MAHYRAKTARLVARTTIETRQLIAMIAREANTHPGFFTHAWNAGRACLTTTKILQHHAMNVQ